MQFDESVNEERKKERKTRGKTETRERERKHTRKETKENMIGYENRRKDLMMENFFKPNEICKALKHVKRWIDDAKQVYTRVYIVYIVYDIAIYLVNEFINEVTLKTEKTRRNYLYRNTHAQ